MGRTPCMDLMSATTAFKSGCLPCKPAAGQPQLTDSASAHQLDVLVLCCYSCRHCCCCPVRSTSAKMPVQGTRA